MSITLPESKTIQESVTQSPRMAFLLALAANAAKAQETIAARHWYDFDTWIFQAVSNLLGWLSRAAIYSDMAASIELARLRNVDRTFARGIVPPADTEERLTLAFQTIAEQVSEVSKVSVKVDRLARSETVAEGQRAYLEAAKAGGAAYWIREPDSNHCGKCVRERFEDFSALVPVHPGCQCDAIIHLGSEEQ